MGWSFGGDWATMREQPEAYPVMLCDLINAVNAKWPIVMKDYWGLADGRYVFGTTLGQAWVEPEPADMADMRLDLLLGELVHELNETIWSLIYGSVVAWCPENTWVNAGDYVESIESGWFPVKYGGGRTVGGPWDVSIVEAAGYARWGGPTSGTRDGVVNNLIFFKEVLSLLRWGWIRWDAWTGEDGAWEDGGGVPSNAALPGAIWTSNYYGDVLEEYPDGPNVLYWAPNSEFMFMYGGFPRLLVGKDAINFSASYYANANNVSLRFRPVWAAQIGKFGTPVASWSQWNIWKNYSNYSSSLSTRHGDIDSWVGPVPGTAELTQARCINGASASGGLYPSGGGDEFFWNMDFGTAYWTLGAFWGAVTWYDFGGGL